MIASLITSGTRIRLLRKFFLNSSVKAHLRGLESEFGESTNAIRVELNRLEGAGLLTSGFVGKRKVFQANSNHPLFSDIHNILLKEVGIDQIIDRVVEKLGKNVSLYLTGDLASGRESHIVDLILIGEKLDREYLARKVQQAEKQIKRKIKYIVLDNSESEKYLNKYPMSELLMLYSSGN